MTQNNGNYLVAITGGIGSGKSTVLKLLRDDGKRVISCDEEVKKLYNEHKVKAQLKKSFPDCVRGEKHLTADKKAIAKLCFCDKVAYEALKEIITMPAFYRAIERAKQIGGVVFIEVPLLFECNLQNYFDSVIVVIRDRNKRIESVKTRSHLTEEEIIERTKNQFDYDNADLSEYVIVDNNGNIENLSRQLKIIGEKICKE